VFDQEVERGLEVRPTLAVTVRSRGFG